MQRRLYRSEHDRLLTGLSGGMADYFDVDPTLMRLLWVLLAIFTGGVAIIVYFVMVVVVPTGAGPAPGIEPGPVGADDEPAAGDASAPGDEPPGEEAAPQQASEPAAPGAAQTYRPYAPERQSDSRSGRLGGAAFVGVALVVIGVLALLDSLGLLAQFDSWRLWPIILIAFGAFLIIRRR